MLLESCALCLKSQCSYSDPRRRQSSEGHNPPKQDLPLPLGLGSLLQGLANYGPQAQSSQWPHFMTCELRMVSTFSKSCKQKEQAAKAYHTWPFTETKPCPAPVVHTTEGQTCMRYWEGASGAPQAPGRHNLRGE